MNEINKINKIIIRPAKSSDGDCIAKIKNYYIENTDVIFTNEKVITEVIEKDIKDNANKYIVAESDGIVLGYACLLDYRSGGYYITKEVSLYVGQGNFRMGLGNKLLTALIEQSKNIELSNLVAYISSSNIQSLSLFEKHGFTNCGELKNIAIKNNEDLTVSILQLDLRKM